MPTTHTYPIVTSKKYQGLNSNVVATIAKRTLEILCNTIGCDYRIVSALTIRLGDDLGRRPRHSVTIHSRIMPCPRCRVHAGGGLVGEFRACFFFASLQKNTKATCCVSNHVVLVAASTQLAKATRAKIIHTDNLVAAAITRSIAGIGLLLSKAPSK